MRCYRPGISHCRYRRVFMAKFTIKLFADDTKLYYVFNNAMSPDCLQSCLSAISAWSDHWQLKLAPLKCSVMAKLHCVLSLFLSVSNLATPKLLTRAFCVFVRPILEYASVIWNPHYENQITKIEGVQPFFYKRLQGLWSHPYHSRFAQLGLDSLYCRTVKADLLVCYKILHNRVYLNCDDFFRARVLIVQEAIQ